MVKPARRVITLDERLAALEDRYGRPSSSGDRRTVGDIVDEHPELAGPLLVLFAWADRGAPPDDLDASEAALVIHRTTSPPPPPPEYPKAGSPYDRPAHRTQEESWR